MVGRKENGRIKYCSVYTSSYAECSEKLAGIKFRDLDGIQILKNYMANGSFARGQNTINADASICFVGNTNDTVTNMLRYSHLFIPFPEEFHDDSAFFDRIHYYLPG